VYDPEAMQHIKRVFSKYLDTITFYKDKHSVLSDSDALLLLTEWPEFKDISPSNIANHMK